MGARTDPISLVEACYDLAASERDWLQRIAQLAQELIRPAPTGVLAYHISLHEGGVQYQNLVEAGDARQAASMIERMGRLAARRRAGQANLFETALDKMNTLVSQGVLRSSVDQMFLSEVEKRGPDWMYTLGVPGVRDVFALINHHVDGNGATAIMGGLRQKGSLQPAQRQMFQMLSAHIKAGLRLRRRLGRSLEDRSAPEQGAVLNAEAKVVHAEGEARDASAREALEQMARRIDTARTGSHGRDERALEIWQGLIDGRWSLVEQFDRDGKRFLLAHRNPEQVVDPRGLTSMESRVTGLAVRGYSNKLIAYHLGVSEGTVSGHLHQTLRKLGLESRVELVRVLGRHYPQATDPRYPVES